jgi:hypothetical protein
MSTEFEQFIAGVRATREAEERARRKAQDEENAARQQRADLFHERVFTLMENAVDKMQAPDLFSLTASSSKNAHGGNIHATLVAYKGRTPESATIHAVLNDNNEVVFKLRRDAAAHNERSHVWPVGNVSQDLVDKLVLQLLQDHLMIR